MNELSISDSPDGGCLSSGPTSPGGASPFLLSEVEAALRSGSRSKNFAKKITVLCGELRGEILTVENAKVSAIHELAFQCRCAREVSKTLGFKNLGSKRRKETRVLPEQSLLSAVLNSGTRSKHFAIKIRKLCRKLPRDRKDYSPEDVVAILALASKCRSTNQTRTFLGCERTRKKIYIPKYKIDRSLTPEQRKENVRKNKRIWKKNKRQTDFGYRLIRSVSRRLKGALNGRKKSECTLVMLGCSANYLRLHLESLWKPGMSWDNYGINGWHVDHIRPCASFNLSERQQQLMCFHYSNLQPLWAAENIAKGAFYKPEL